jgi:hypothetical protein
MKEILINALPGVLALFLLDADYCTTTEKRNECDETTDSVDNTQFLPVVAPYGFNHRNINIEAIQQNTTYDYSLKDVYSKQIFSNEYNNNMISSIEDNIDTPVIIVPFSIEKERKSESNDKLMNILNNTAIANYIAIPPKISIDLPPVEIAQTPVQMSGSSDQGQSERRNADEKGLYHI